MPESHLFHPSTRPVRERAAAEQQASWRPPYIGAGPLSTPVGARAFSQLTKQYPVPTLPPPPPASALYAPPVPVPVPAAVFCAPPVPLPVPLPAVAVPAHGPRTLSPAERIMADRMKSAPAPADDGDKAAAATAIRLTVQPTGEIVMTAPSMRLVGHDKQAAEAEALAAAASPAFEVEVQSGDTVDMLKSKIQDQIGRAPDSMHLRVGDTVLYDDEKSVMEYPELIDRVTILMDLRKRGS